MSANGNSQDDHQSLSEVLRNTHARNLTAYKRLLSAQECSANETNEPPLDIFWDVVVITASDKQHRLVYEHRIDQKLARGQIPTSVKYHVVEDPPQSKIGGGGSTFLVMKVLREMYSQEFLENARVLLIHAGGYSTRLPHVSARGKIFTTLPQADSQQGIDVLDLKFVLYMHLLKDMPPGVFLTSADGIELFSSNTPFPSQPKARTITALAHPSSTRIGSTHGVYLLQDPNGIVDIDRKLRPEAQSARLLKCQQFIHKPSLETMQKIPMLIHGDASNDDERIVYTDSCYYFDPKTAEIMADTYPKLHPECDLEAWADILSFQNNVPSLESSNDQQIVKQALQEAGIALDVMVLNASRFYHLGTMQEFLEAVCVDKAFMSELNIRNKIEGLAEVDNLIGSIATKESYGNPHIQIDKPSYIENSSFSACSGTLAMPTSITETKVLANSILVDCDLPAGTIIPLNTCMFVLQLQEQEFVTFTFSIYDDMKKEARIDLEIPSAVFEELKIFQKVPLSAVIEQPRISSMDLSMAATYNSGFSLWNAPLFEIARTKQDSILCAIRRLNIIRNYLDAEKEGIIADADGFMPEIVGWTSLKTAAKRAREYFNPL
ncbi:hypothetical protein BX616_002385 [Lobosporangium transversale]|uniref:L-fucokinase-domain-containing protein n=1 Tax=Lobosporangium transversale TaxID=64571 RepID=A0A1Y2GMU2_9FUNG|nr:L-fucokinase-domain-containing protein [Lobosporangium transversale]KAF9901091.1 hypothetical protein BX616_002385 [Lobosporangium transversale]ORZ12048.1 L-fucokinase-domain-containing protein [Lobosporangium transversale]|eukprot:XP_021879913.1 L-fucokinase-domain-containing protein [Lobosporangium transversale]